MVLLFLLPANLIMIQAESRLFLKTCCKRKVSTEIVKSESSKVAV